jgi:cardiolipin synthase
MGAPRAIAERIADTLDPFRRPHYSDGNRIALLASAQQYFPRLHAAIAGAQRCVWLETYILADDATGAAVLDALRGAAQRGVDVRVLVDGFGGGEFVRRLKLRFPEFGAQLRIYRPERWWRPARRLFHRLHRKIAVIDDRIAFVGGMNVDDSPAHDELTGEPIGPRLDFAVECQGPIVADIAFAVRRLWWSVAVAALSDRTEPLPRRVPRAAPFPDGVRAAIILRDNLRHRRSIEHSYLGAVRAARRQIVIASAYFQPGQRFRRALVAAARRGVRVTLLLQGRVEYRLQHYAQRALYGQLLAAGMEIHEYRRSYLHAKVAVIDQDWATVGSSNIDPLSLLLAREANVVVRDSAFCDQLRGDIEAAIRDDSQPLQAADYARRSVLTRAIDWIAYGAMRVATAVLARRSYWTS